MSYCALSGTKEPGIYDFSYFGATSLPDVCVNWNRLRTHKIFYNNKNYTYFIIITITITRKKVLNQESCNFFSDQIESCWNLLYEYFQQRSVLGIREKEEKGQGLILHLGKIKVVNTNAVFLTSSWSKCALDTALLLMFHWSTACVHLAA